MAKKLAHTGNRKSHLIKADDQFDNFNDHRLLIAVRCDLAYSQARSPGYICVQIQRLIHGSSRD